MGCKLEGANNLFWLGTAAFRCFSLALAGKGFPIYRKDKTKQLDCHNSALRSFGRMLFTIRGICMVNKTGKETIVFGGGCFWCTEAVFKMLQGVISVNPGYAGGTTKNPTYEDICNGGTGHAEVIKIEYNPEVISLETLLTVCFATHDPTTKSRQGNDVGEQYRSIILCDKADQIELAKKFIADLNSSNKKGAPIVTEVKPLDTFYPAEDYHKNYYENNKNQSYCQVVINPKLKKVQEHFTDLLKKKL